MEAFALEKYGEKQNTCNFLDQISEREDITLYHLDAAEDVSFGINIHGSMAADSSSDSIQTGSLLEGTLCIYVMLEDTEEVSVIKGDFLLDY